MASKEILLGKYEAFQEALSLKKKEIREQLRDIDRRLKEVYDYDYEKWHSEEVQDKDKKEKT